MCPGGIGSNQRIILKITMMHLPVSQKNPGVQVISPGKEQSGVHAVIMV
jgi:hypothetical protein